MTPKELKRLSRSDLLEMLLELSKENDRLRQEAENLRQQLEEQNIAIENCGSIAEAALQLNGVFQAAQAACDQYTRNIRARNAALEERCRQAEQDAKDKSEAILAQAREQARLYMEEAQAKFAQQEQKYAWLAELMDNGEKA